jgi:hypothetical protein
MAELATRAHIVALKSDVLAVKADVLAVEAGLKQDIAALEQRFQLALENLSLRLTVRLGILLAAGIAALGAIIKF